MRPKFHITLVPLIFAMASAYASAAPIPSSTDEARALGASAHSKRCDNETPPAPGSPVVSSTDEARALAGRALAAAPWRQIPRHHPTFVSSTDEARAAAGVTRVAPDCEPAPVAAH